MNQQFEARDTYAFRLNEWYDKTKWVQETVQPGERDMHRADIIKLRFQQVEAQRDALLEALEYAIKQVPELGTVLGIAAAIAAVKEKE